MFSALLSALAISTSGQAATQGAQEVYQAPDVIIDGRPLEEAATAFVDEVADPPGQAHMSRWNTPICVSMANMRAPYGQLFVDRVSAHAAELGVDVSRPGCTPNVVIVATQNGRATAEHLVEHAGLSFRPTNGPTNPSRAALRAFRTSEAPVRWWNIGMPVSRDTGDPAFRPRGGPSPIVNVYAGSRLTSSIRYDMQAVIVVVDLNRTAGVSMSALADYVSMVTLAQIDPETDVRGYDTILNAFEDPVHAQGLSDWDRSYLEALYSGEANRFNRRQQRSELIGSLVQSRRNEVAGQE